MMQTDSKALMLKLAEMGDIFCPSKNSEEDWRFSRQPRISEAEERQSDARLRTVNTQCLALGIG